MKYTFYYFLLPIIIFSCTEVVEKKDSNRNVKKHIEQTKDTQDSIFNQELLKYSISFNYESNSATQISNESVKILFSLLEEVKKEAFVSKKENVIFEIETIINKNISVEAANKRIKNIINIINMSIGVDAENVPLIKNIHYFKWGNRNDNYIKVSLNRLMY